MARIQTVFSRLKSQQKQALIPYITAGDPHPAATVGLMHALVAGGADIVELGVPFSDPMADGPVIQKASERALAHGVSLTNVLEMVRDFRRRDAETPVVLMGYANPVEAMGYEVFAKAASEAGVDGVLTVDLPPEEAAALSDTLKAHGLDPIFLLAPTTPDWRV
ncbi:MAG: tryptophan synthase subunit alpha, partial [Chitinimonas sp.]|nr:tryptophan synthase subunit alpha [Chitinimonas sp.]